MVSAAILQAYSYRRSRSIRSMNTIDGSGVTEAIGWQMTQSNRLHGVKSEAFGGVQLLDRLLGCSVRCSVLGRLVSR